MGPRHPPPQLGHCQVAGLPLLLSLTETRPSAGRTPVHPVSMLTSPPLGQQERMPPTQPGAALLVEVNTGESTWDRDAGRVLLRGDGALG